ncbi:K Homology domain-containing protein [Artemisia annua]|uniref:K Homology domain-containing protein n=1 Tax=Artemisia annua TaxID=35608 RepID=A0A2U1L126_ARTAN|nr:K Homology domain-containing protein [Artemisia annua]
MSHEDITITSPLPSDHKRKLNPLDTEPFDQPPLSVESNGQDDLDVKRQRFDDNNNTGEGVENGHREEKAEEPKEDVTEPSEELKNESLDGVKNDSVADETVKEEVQESGAEQRDGTKDVVSQGDVSGVKDETVSGDGTSSRKMEVPSNKVGVLIGKAGDTIRTLQNSSGARIQITRDAEADPNSATRPVQLIGSIESINKAERLIKEVIAEADAGGSPSLIARGYSNNSSGFGEQTHIQVPNEKVGVIIGKGGETIKYLQSRSGARIQLIPQHLPEGDQSKERSVRITGDWKQIEAAKQLIKEVMDQPMRPGGNNHQNFGPRGSGPQWGGPRGHPSESSGYNNYPPRGGYSSQNPPYSSQGYQNYPPQQLPPRNNHGWEQRPPTNMQGPPDQRGYDYYGGPPPAQPPMHSRAPGPAMGPPSQANYNYGQPQGPDYRQQPAPYSQTAPQGYGQGYGEPRYDHQGPGQPSQHPYGGQGTQPSTYPQGTTNHPSYGQQDQYNKPATYNTPQQAAPYGQQPYGQPQQQPSSGSMPQPYPQYGIAPMPTVNDGYSNSGPAPGGYGQQGGQPVSVYVQNGGQQQAPGYAQAGPTTGYGYQGAPDPTYGAPPVQPAYSQPAPAQAPVQPGYDQSIPQTGGYVSQPQPQAQPQPGYGQF